MDELTCRTVLALTESLNRAISENIYQREVIRGLEGRIKGLEARLGERPSIVYPDGHPEVEARAAACAERETQPAVG